LVYFFVYFLVYFLAPGLLIIAVDLTFVRVVLVVVLEVADSVELVLDNPDVVPLEESFFEEGLSVILFLDASFLRVGD
jgi:hypothetical protein